MKIITRDNLRRLISEELLLQETTDEGNSVRCAGCGDPLPSEYYEREDGCFCPECAKKRRATDNMVEAFA